MAGNEENVGNSESEVPVAHESPSHTKYIDLVRAELDAMDPKAVLGVNVDVVVAAMTVLGVVEHLPAYRPGLVELFGEERVSKLDRLELLAHATLQAHGRYRGLDSSIQLGPLAKEATKFRDVLLAEVRQLIARDVLDAGTIGELSGRHGHKNLYLDLLQLIAVFRANESEVADFCAVRSDYLDRAENVAARFAKAVGMKEQATQPAAADLRNRAFSLLWNTYEELRRLMTCLRWHEGDYDRIAPTFFAGRPTAPRRPRAEERAVEPTAAPGMPGAPAFETPIEGN